MTTLPEQASKGEKGKSKYQCLDINNLYQISRGESLEPHAAKSTVPRKHGMQLLGKVPTISRRPVNLPSLKAETTGSDTTVSLAPSGPGSASAPVTSQTWGKTPTTSDITTPPTQSVTALNTPTTGSLTPHQAAIALPVSTTIPVQPPKGQPQAPLTTPSIAAPVPVTQSHDKSWSAVMIGSDLPGVGQPPPYQSPQFQHEFPSLSGAVTEEGVALVTGQKGGADTQYGPGPSLRPQTEGSWMQGGCGAPATEVGNSVLQGSAPVGHNVPQAPPSQFRVAIPSFMYRGNFPQNNGPNGPVNQNQQGMPGAPSFHQVTSGAIGGNATLPAGQQSGTGGTRANSRVGPGTGGRQMPVVIDELAQRPIIKEEDLNRMDDMTRDAGWAMHDEIDYNQKIAFSDDEIVPDRERRVEVDAARHTSSENDKPVDDRHVARSCEDEVQGPRMVATNRAWSQYRSKDSRGHGSVGGNAHANNRPGLTRGSVRSAEDDELWEQRRRNQQKEVELACVRAKQRREEEDKRFKDTREGANKKLQELEKKLEDKKTMESKTFDESQGTIDPASVPPQVITPVPIPVPDWQKERENRDRERENRDRDRERDDDRDVRDDDRDMLRQQRNPSASDFKRLTQIEGRCVMRSVDKDRERENRKRNHDVPRTERDREREVRERDGANFSRQFQLDLPPRFKKPPVQSSRNPSSQIGGSSFAQQYDPRRIQPPVQQASNRRNRNDSDVDVEDERRELRRDRPASDDGRRRSSVVHRSYGDPPTRKPSSNDSRDSREREIGDSREDRYRDDFKNNFRADDYDYRGDGADIESDRERRDRDRDREIRREDRSRTEDKRPSSDSYDDHDRDINRQDCKDRREDRIESRREVDRARNDDRRHQFDRDEYERKETKEDRARDIERVPQRDDKYVQREERPQRPDSRDSRVSRESRQSRDSARESEPREYCGSWADEKAPFETDEKRKDRFCEEKDWRVPGPITRKKIESDELRNERRNPTRLKRSSSGIITLDERKSDVEKSDEKTERKQSVLTNDVAWNIDKKESTPLRNSTENIQKIQTDMTSSNSALENIEPAENSEHETVKSIHEKSPKLDNEEEFTSEIDIKRADKEQVDLNKDDKRTNSMNQRGSRGGGRNNKSSNWGNGSYSVYRGSWGGRGGGNGRRPPRMSSQRSSTSREFRITDSEPSGDEISASTTESGREECGPRKSPRSPKPLRKIDKEEKNREIGQEKLSAGGSGSISSERRYEKQRSFDSNGARSDDARDVFVPRGEPSRRGRGGFRPRGPIGKRIDGYGPPSSKSPFGGQRLQSRQTDIDNEKGVLNTDMNRDIFGVDEKTKHSRGITASIANNSRNRQKSVGTEVPPRMQKKSDGETRRDGSKNSRGASSERKRGSELTHKTNRSDGGDEGWETTSNNSDTESERREARKANAGNKAGSDVRTQSSRTDVQRRQSSTNTATVNGPSSNQSQNGNRSKTQTRQTTSKAPGAEKRAGGPNSYQNKNSGTQNQPDRQNSNGSIKSNQSSGHKASKESSIGRSDESNEINEAIDALSVVFSDSGIKDKESKKGPECTETNHYSGTETQDGNSDEGSYSQCDADGFREVRSKKNVKERQKDEKDKPPTQHSRVTPKPEKEPPVNVSTRNSKCAKSGNPIQITPQQPINISTSLVSNNPTTNTGKSQFERSRLRKLPPRLERQRENDRLHKTRLQGCDVNEMNKLNQSVSLYTVKEGTPPAPIPQVNAWDKPITTQLRTAIDRDALNMSIDGRVDMDRAQHSGASSQRSSPNADKPMGVHCQVQEKVMLDGSTPPVNTIIFENTNYKSVPGITGDLAIKAKFNTQMKNTRIDKNRGSKSDDGDVDDVGVLSFNKPMSDMIGGKSDKPDPIQLPISFNKAEDSADMKLDFTFETELSRLTEDKNAKGLGLARSMHTITSVQNTISPSAAELNLKIASVKKVWENMPTVIEHTGEDNGVNSASSFASALDPANAFNKSSDPSDENHEVYSPSPSHNIQNAANNTTNVCKVKPTQQQATSAVTHHVGAPSNSNQMGHVGTSTVPTVATGGPGQPNHMGAAHTLSPPPVQVLGLGQPPQAYTGANQHINYQPSLGGNAQFGGISAIPSPPTVLFNNSGQMPTQGGLYNTFQMDQSRSQYSQYPPGPYGLGQTASSPYNTAQSMYLQTAPPHPPPNAQPPPDMYQSIPSQYRMATTGPFGQSQQLNNNPSTVLISSTSNSLMSASVKPSSQQIGAIGTKAGAIGQTYGAQSQQGGQLYIPYDPSLQASYLQRGPGGPVQSSVVPAQMQASNSYYSASAGGQTGFYQQPGGSALQSAPLHQNSFGLQTNVFGGSVHGGSTAGTLQNFSSPFLSSQIQLAALSAQQFRQPGTVSGLANPTGGVPTGAQQQSQQSVRPQQLKSPGSQNQQDMLTSVFNSAPQIPSPKSRSNCKQPPPQPSPTQHKYSSQYQNVSAQQSAQLVLQQQQSNRQQPNINMSVGAGSRGAQLAAGNQTMSQTHYPAPIQRPGAAFQPAPGSMSGGGGGGQRSLRGQQPGQQTRPHPTGQRQGQQQQYYSGQGGNVPSQPDKGEESKLSEANASNGTTNTSKNINSNVINKTSNSTNNVNSAGQNSETNKEVNVKNDGNASGKD